MIKFIVERPKDTVEVLLMKHKVKEKWSYVNLTKGHICPCEFNNIEEAISDMDKQIKEGKIIRYYKKD